MSMVKTVAETRLRKGPFRAARGTEISCKSWQQEAALRMLMNNLDPEVAEKPEELVVYGGTGKAARNWECFHAIVKSLRGLANDETLLVQSGKPVGIFRTHEYAPRVLLCNSNLVGHWNNWDQFHEFDRAGLMMYGQMTAGSWIYIGTQGILQGTYETFAAAATKHFDGDLKGKLVVSGGIGGMGGAPPPPKPKLTGPLRVGGNVQAARIINRVQPSYPPLARQTRISGTVRLHAIIGKDGTIQQLEVMNGHPLLQQAALDAVRQWRYQPTLLNGEPVEVDTTIDVIFSLNQ